MHVKEAREKEKRKKVTPRGAENFTEEEVASSKSPAVEQEEEDGPSASYWELLKDFHKDQRSIEVWRQWRQRQADLRQDRKENCSKPEHPPDPPENIVFVFPLLIL